MIYLSYLERWIAWRICDHLTYNQIGSEIGLTEDRMGGRVKRLYRRVGAATRVQFQAWWHYNRHRCEFYSEAL